MKAYKVPKGTKGKLIVQEEFSVEVRDWVVRKDLTFDDTIVDPVRFHNHPGDYDSGSLAVELVLKGYSLFGEQDSRYVLAVPYENVTVS